MARADLDVHPLLVHLIVLAHVGVARPGRDLDVDVVVGAAQFAAVDALLIGCVARNSLRREELVQRLALGGDTEEALDELRLPCCVSPVQLFDLSLPQYVHRLDTF